jgi:glycosyltransferase involved in cell wall biosynthesis
MAGAVDDDADVQQLPRHEVVFPIPKRKPSRAAFRKNLTSNLQNRIKQLSNESLQQVGVKPPVLFYTHALVGGGAERVWAQTAAGLFERGYNVEFCVDWDAPENAHLLPRGMTVHRLGRNHAGAIWRLSKLISAKKYFAAFSAVGASNIKLLAAKALSVSRVHPVLSQHGHFEAESRFLGRLGYRLTALTSRLAATTIVVSDALKHDLEARFWASPQRVLRIYNAIELALSTHVPSYAALRARPDAVLAVGRLVPEKGHADLLDAIAHLPATVTLTIAGEGPERPRLEEKIAKLGLTGRVSLPGYLTDPGSAYRQAKVLALPSHTEAFGNVVVEALGFGLPVVATDCGGPAEILGHGAFGALVPPRDAAEMANALALALKDPGDPLRWRERAGAFSVDRILDEYEAVLKALPGWPDLAA